MSNKPARFCALLLAFWMMLLVGNEVMGQPPRPGWDNNGKMVAYSQIIPGTDVKIEMVPVSEASAERGEKISAFWIGKYEVTRAQYDEFLKLHDLFVHRQHQTRDLQFPLVDGVSAPTPIYDPTCRYEYSALPDSPTPSMSQFGARQFTKWLSLLSGFEYRLPSEREWIHACRADHRLRINSDSNLRQHAVFGWPWPDQYKNQEHEVLRIGTKQPNGWGVHDMHGSLAEYVIENDVFDSNGKLTEGYRAHCAYGGSFANCAAECQCESYVEIDRAWWQDDAHLPQSPMWLARVDDHLVIGFRILRSTTPMTETLKKIAWEPDSQELAAANEDRIESGRQRFGRVSVVSDRTNVNREAE